jgi:hypothetical protein
MFLFFTLYLQNQLHFTALARLLPAAVLLAFAGTAPDYSRRAPVRILLASAWGSSARARPDAAQRRRLTRCCRAFVGGPGIGL